MAEDIKHSKLWLRDSTGERSATVTLLAVSFVVTTLYFIMTLFDQIGPLSIRAFDATAVSVYFTPILMGYVTRRWTAAKYEEPSAPADTVPPVVEGE